MPRILDRFGLVPIIESKDYGSAGIDSDSWKMDKAASVGIIISCGALTGNSTIIIYTGATAGAKTTAIAFRFRVTNNVFKNATGADQYAAVAAVASTGLVLTGATYAHMALVIDLDASELSDTQPYLTVSVDNVATVLNLAAFAVLSIDRYLPAPTNIV